MSKKPVHTLRMGRIKAAVFENDTAVGIRHGIVISRLFKDGDEWKQSSSFGRDDLLLVAQVSERVNIWLHEQQQHQRPSQAPETSTDDIPF